MVKNRKMLDMIERYGVDAFRYFLIAEMTLGQDASFTEEAFVKRYNSDLANDLGNVTNRVLNMISRYCDGKMPQPLSSDAEFDLKIEQDLWTEVTAVADSMNGLIDQMKLDGALASVTWAPGSSGASSDRS